MLVVLSPTPEGFFTHATETEEEYEKLSDCWRFLFLGMYESLRT